MRYDLRYNISVGNRVFMGLRGSLWKKEMKFLKLDVLIFGLTI